MYKKFYATTEPTIVNTDKTQFTLILEKVGCCNVSYTVCYGMDAVTKALAKQKVLAAPGTYRVYVRDGYKLKPGDDTCMRLATFTKEPKKNFKWHRSLEDTLTDGSELTGGDDGVYWYTTHKK